MTKTPYTTQELKEQILLLQRSSRQLPEIKPFTPYFFVGPTPMTGELSEMLENPEVFQSYLDRKYNQGVTHEEDRITTRSLLQRSFRSEKAVNKVLPEAFSSMARSLVLPETHRLGQVNGGGHPACVATVNNLLVIDPQSTAPQNIYVDSNLGGAFRNDLTLRQVKKTAKRYLGKEEYKSHIITESNGRTLPTAEELEAQGIKFFFGTVNETSTAHRYSEKDWEELRKWKEKDPENRFITVDITSAVGETELSKYWDIIDAAFFPPQKAISAPPETGFIVFGPHALHFMEQHKAVGLNVTEKLFRDPAKGEESKLRVLKDDLFFDPKRPTKPMSVHFSVNLKKFVEITISSDHYLDRGGERESLFRGERNLAIMEEWMNGYKERAKGDAPIFDFFIHEPEHRSRSVGIIDITDPRFRRLAPEVQDKCLKRFHDLIGDQGVTLMGDKELIEENSYLAPNYVAYDIKTFPTTPLPEYKKQEIDKIRGIRFWLNIDQEKLQSLLSWIEPIYSRALEITLQEELGKLEKGQLDSKEKEQGNWQKKEDIRKLQKETQVVNI